MKIGDGDDEKMENLYRMIRETAAPSGVVTVFETRFLERVLREAREQACTHYKVMPKFDSVAARGLDSYQVRERWPRFDGTCPDCGEGGIYYASYEHYIAGDW
jgi:hypothetical protein